MARLIEEELSIILPGFIYTITGGYVITATDYSALKPNRYRRGKAESNDVDIVYSHPKNGRGAGSIHVLINRLRSRGLITHVLRKE